MNTEQKVDLKFIVAEVSKNWTQDTPVSNTISSQFEQVINVNWDRGYKLIDWKIKTVVTGDNLLETIIAVFERRKLEPGDPGYYDVKI